MIKWARKILFAGSFIRFLLFCFLCPFSMSASQVQEILAKIPKEDLASIQQFFNYVVYLTPSPFTLLGDKPISLIDCLIETNPMHVVASSYFYGIRKNFEVWKKYASLFPSKKFVFIENSYPDLKILSIILINKEACIEMIEDHLSQFQEILGKELESQHILHRILSSSDLCGETLHNNQGLYGLLLGFGKTNAFRFHDIYSNKLPYKPLSFFSKDSYEPLFSFRIPEFAAVSDDPETISLEKKYREQRETIIEAYSNKDFLEVTLTKFMEN